MRIISERSGPSLNLKYQSFKWNGSRSWRYLALTYGVHDIDDAEESHIAIVGTTMEWKDQFHDIMIRLGRKTNHQRTEEVLAIGHMKSDVREHEAIFPILDGTVKSADKHFDDDDKLDAKHIEHIARIGEVQHSECQVGTEALNSVRTVGHEDKLQQTSRKPCFSCHNLGHLAVVLVRRHAKSRDEGHRTSTFSDNEIAASRMVKEDEARSVPSFDEGGGDGSASRSESHGVKRAKRNREPYARGLLSSDARLNDVKIQMIPDRLMSRGEMCKRGN
jgi:hypothetical protein